MGNVCSSLPVEHYDSQLLEACHVDLEYHDGAVSEGRFASV